MVCASTASLPALILAASSEVDKSNPGFALEAQEPDQRCAGYGAFMDGAVGQRAEDGKDEWLTPPSIRNPLGEFDLDPCAPLASRRPWPTAKQHFTIEDNGLRKAWVGRVWLNPPYRRDQMLAWMMRMAEHGNGIALTFARTDTDWFQRAVFEAAHAILFLRGRITFLNIDGSPSRFNGGAPSCLIAYGKANRDCLEYFGPPGALVTLRL